MHLTQLVFHSKVPELYKIISFLLVKSGVNITHSKELTHVTTVTDANSQSKVPLHFSTFSLALQTV